MDGVKANFESRLFGKNCESGKVSSNSEWDNGGNGEGGSGTTERENRRMGEEEQENRRTGEREKRSDRNCSWGKWQNRRSESESRGSGEKKRSITWKAGWNAGLSHPISDSPLLRFCLLRDAL